MNKQQAHNIIPEGLVRCVWMDAGMVSYKLCDRNLQCDGCPFDTIFRQHEEATLLEREAMLREESVPSIQTAEENIQKQLDALLAPLGNPQLPDDRLYCTNHTWFRKEDDGSLTVGIDHLGAHLLGSVACLVLPQTPTHTHALSPCVWIMRTEGAIALRNPISGVITTTNNRLKKEPSLLTDDPYGKGWIFKLNPEEEQTEELLRADEAQKIYSTQGEMLRDEFSKRISKRAHVGLTLHDGGQHVESLQEAIGSKAYFSVIVRTFDVPKT